MGEAKPKAVTKTTKPKRARKKQPANGIDLKAAYTAIMTAYERRLRKQRTNLDVEEVDHGKKKV